MSAGTLTLTNNSAAVSGTGTAFNTELAAGDFIVVTVGGVPYTLPIKLVESATALTLVSVYTGPTQAGASWSAVPRVALNMVTAALVAQSAEALRGLNYDKQNWQNIFSGTGNVPVTLPDGTTWTGPAWNSITTSLSGKAEKGANSDITSLSGLTTALSVAQGGTGSATPSGARTNLELGNSATRNVGNASGTVAAGDDSRLATVDGKTGGNVTGNLYSRKIQAGAGAGSSIGSSIAAAATGSAHTSFMMIPEVAAGGDRYGHLYLSQDGVNKDWFFNFSSGTAWSPGGWQNSSDIRIKDEIERIQDPLEKMKMLRGCSWIRKDDGMKGAYGMGFIAQEVQEVFPHAVLKGLTGTITVDGKTIEDPLSIEPGAIAAALHHEAILALMSEVESMHEELEQLKAK